MKEKIDGIMRDETLTRYEKTDQILALLSGEMEKVENHYDKRRLLQGVWWEGDTWRSEGFEDFRQKVLALLREVSEGGAATEVLDDGFGNQWSPICPDCGQNSISIVRPGKVQCSECE